MGAPKFVRMASTPGWKHQVRSAGAAKSKDQREVERRARQLEKLPSPVALHDHQYPHLKTVLCDQHFQTPVYSNQLDTPELFNLVPPDDFFVNWSIKDCGRTAYPPVPQFDHRHTQPVGAEWAEHRDVCLDYLAKHEIVPQVFPSCPMQANLVACFSPNGELARENFWHTSHCGNFMELKCCQQRPSVAVRVANSDPSKLYTVLMISPDFPSRSAPSAAGLFLHWAACNLTATPENRPFTDVAEDLVSFVPPLPTEDAGCCRVIFALFEQSKRIDNRNLAIDFATRSAFRIGGTHHDAVSRILDDALAPVPSALTFFTTCWDIQVQEWYAANNLPEPVFVPEDLERILRLNAMPKEKFQISGKTQADGTINATGEVDHNQYGETVLHRRGATHLLSSRSMLSRDRKRYTTIQRPAAPLF